jgi:hypothetical protein
MPSMSRRYRYMKAGARVVRDAMDADGNVLQMLDDGAKRSKSSSVGFWKSHRNLDIPDTSCGTLAASFRQALFRRYGVPASRCGGPRENSVLPSDRVALSDWVSGTVRSPSPLSQKCARSAWPAFAAGWPVRPQACHQAVVTIKAPSLSGQDGIPTGDPGMRVALYRGQAASVIRQCAATGGPHARR